MIKSNPDRQTEEFKKVQIDTLEAKIALLQHQLYMEMEAHKETMALKAQIESAVDLILGQIQTHKNLLNKLV